MQPHVFILVPPGPIIQTTQLGPYHMAGKEPCYVTLSLCCSLAKAMEGKKKKFRWRNFHKEVNLMSQHVTKIPWVSFSTQKCIKRWASAIFLLHCAENTRGKAPGKPLLLWYLSWTWLPGAAPHPWRSLQV